MCDREVKVVSERARAFNQKSALFIRDKPLPEPRQSQ